MKDITRDTILDGKVVIYQTAKGYRFSMDAVILAALTESGCKDLVADLGTGCGIVSIILGYKRKAARIVGLEIQQDLAELALRNVRENRLDGVIEIRNMDFRTVSDCFPEGSFDVVVTNPPYRPLKSGRINPSSQKAVARHEVTATLGDIFSASLYLLKDGGRLSVIYPSRRLDDLIIKGYKWNFRPKKMTMIHSHIKSRAELVHVIFRKQSGQELMVMPPLFVYKSESKEYTQEMQSLYEG